MRTSSAVILATAITSVLLGATGAGLTAYAYEVLVVGPEKARTAEAYRVIGNLLDITDACTDALDREENRADAYLKAGSDQREAIDLFFTPGISAAGDVAYLYSQLQVSDEFVLLVTERPIEERRARELCAQNPFD